MSAATAPDQRSAPLAGALLALGLLLATTVGWSTLDQSPDVRVGVMATICINLALMLAAIAVEGGRRPYSLHLMHLLGLFLFLGAPALFQYSVGRFAVAGAISGVQNQVFGACVAVTLWILGYLISYEMTRLLGGRRRGPIVQLLSREVTVSRATGVLFVAFVALAYLGAAGLLGVSTRGAALKALNDFTIQTTGGQSIAFFLIHQMLLRSISLVALLIALLVLVQHRAARNPIFLGLFGLVGLITLVANNPFAASRMWLATSVIAFLAPFGLKRLRSGWGLVLIAAGGVAFLPSLNESRYTETLNEFLDYLTVVSPMTYLSNSSDVDSLGMLTLCFRWLESHDHRFGMQLIGASLFWFPRSFWPGKPIETGAMVTRDLGFDFTNLAPPIMSDPMVDFGFIGVPVVAALFGFILARLDRGYWEREQGGAPVRVIDAFYPFWIGCVLFLTRGGMFASLTFTVGFSAWVVLVAIGAARRRAADTPSTSEPFGSGFRDAV